MKIALRGGLLVVFALLAACSSAPTVTPEEAETSFCGRLPLPDIGDVEAAAAVERGYGMDADLYEQAGDPEMARDIRDALEGSAEVLASIDTDVFLLDEITPREQMALQRAILKMPSVEGMNYMSKTDAYEQALVYFADEPDIIRNLSPDALPASFEVATTDPAALEAAVTGLPGVEQVRVPAAAERFGGVFLLQAETCGYDVPPWLLEAVEAAS